MRVVHLVCVAPPEIGGMGNAALREVEGLRAKGIDALLIAPTAPGITESTDAIQRVVPHWRLGNAATLGDLKSLTTGADVIHLHYPFYGTAESLLLSELKIPVVATFHMDAQTSDWRQRIIRFHQRWVQPRLLNRVKRVLVSSLDYARHSSLASFLIRHPERVRELPFGVDTEIFSRGPSQRERFGLPSDAPLFLFVGGLDRAHAFKGIEQLVQAFARVDKTAHLVIRGDGDRKAIYEQEMRRLGVRDRVHFLPRLSQTELRDLYRSVDVFVFPSTCQAEAFGLVALEAQACGVPVIASDLPGVRTVVRDEETGLLVPPGDVGRLSEAMQRLLNDVPLRHTLALRARTIAHESYAEQQHIDQLIQVYQSVCGSRS